MTSRVLRVLAVASLAALAVPVCADAADRLPRVGLVDEPAGAALRVIDAAGPLPFPLAVLVNSTTFPEDPSLDSRIAALEARHVRIALAVHAPRDQQAIERWRAALKALVDKRAGALALVDIDLVDAPPAVATFAIRAAAVDIRSVRQGIAIAVSGGALQDAASRNAIYNPATAPYIDAVVVDRADASLFAFVSGVDPMASIVVDAGMSDVDVAVAQVVDATLGELGGPVALHVWPARDPTRAALRALTAAADLLDGDISVLAPEGAGLSVRVSGTDATRTVAHRLLFDDKTFATYLVYWGEAGASLQVTLTLPVEGVPGVRDLVAGTHSTATRYVRDRATGRVDAEVPLTGRPMIVDFNEGAAEVTVERSGVSAARPLTIGEIIARHQQQQREQDAAVHHYIARARMQQHFRPTVADNGMASSFDVVTENRYFVAGADVEWEELSFAVNGAKFGADRPPFPMLQPEKVLSLPLQLRFDDGYTYRLAGSDRVDGFDCYVVKFEPVRQDSALYRGTVWIDKKTFARVQVQAVQSGLAAPVVSNEETQHYTPVAVGNRPVFLFSGLTARQIVLLAGRNLLVEKSVEFADFKVNSEDFERERDSAREGEHVMFRETDRGLRDYVKERGTRVISDRTTSHAKALAMGTTVDPTYAFPLPMFGIDYLKFHFGSDNQQLAVLFAGVLAAGNIQRTKIGRTPFDASVDFFGIAVPASDRLYGPAGELASERVLNWPETAGLNVGWQATPFQKATLQYQTRFDAYVHDRTTAENFVTPSSTVTNGIGGMWEYRRGGYSVVGNAMWFDRLAWRSWGAPGSDTAAAAPLARYWRYQGTLSRDFYLDALQKIHVNASWFSGRDLDRFSQYQFGMFDDTRIHGVPGSGVRYGELAMVRGAYSWNLFDQYRFDLFLDQAWGRALPSHGTWSPITGFGVAVNVRAPRNTILRADVGKSILPDPYGSVGSTVFQILLLKPIR